MGLARHPSIVKVQMTLAGHSIYGTRLRNETAHKEHLIVNLKRPSDIRSPVYLGANTFSGPRIVYMYYYPNPGHEEIRGVRKSLTTLQIHHLHNKLAKMY